MSFTVQLLPSTIEEDRNPPLGVPDQHVSLTSRAYVPSILANIVTQGILHACQEPLEAEREPSIPPRQDPDEAEDRAAAKQREEHEKRAIEDNLSKSEPKGQGGTAP